MQTKCTYDKEQFIKKVYYSRVLNKHVGLNKHIGGKIFENQIIVLLGINTLRRGKWNSGSGAESVHDFLHSSGMFSSM